MGGGNRAVSCVLFFEIQAVWQAVSGRLKERFGRAQCRKNKKRY